MNILADVVLNVREDDTVTTHEYNKCLFSRLPCVGEVVVINGYSGIVTNVIHYTSEVSYGNKLYCQV